MNLAGSSFSRISRILIRFSDQVLILGTMRSKVAPEMEAAKNVKWVGIALITISGLIHLYLAPEYFEEYGALYGTAFVLNFLGAAVAAVGIYRGESNWGWAPGAVIAAGVFVLYVASVTVGLPGRVREGLEPVGLLSLIVEVGFVVVFAKAALDRKRFTRNSPA